MSIECDPRYGPALAWAAVCHHRLRLLGSIEDREGDRLKGTAFARRALKVAGDDPVIIANAAFALGFFGEDIGAMIALVDRALALNPSYARGWHLSGNLRVMQASSKTRANIWRLPSASVLEPASAPRLV